MSIAVLALDGVFDTGLAAILDTLTAVNELASFLGGPAPDFRVSGVGMRAEASTAHGMKVPALGYKMPEASAENQR